MSIQPPLELGPTLRIGNNLLKEIRSLGFLTRIATDLFSLTVEKNHLSGGIESEQGDVRCLDYLAVKFQIVVLLLRSRE